MLHCSLIMFMVMSISAELATCFLILTLCECSCRSDQWGAVCLCLPGYSGDLCELKDDLCVSSPCLNGGTCLGLVNDFVCKCESGWTGKHCERQHDPCRGANPCLHGTCHTLLGGRFHCQCLPGYSGELCERRNVCTADCINGTLFCHEPSWQCNCQHGGETCGRNAVVSAAPSPCSSRPCANNATCRLSELEPLGYVCACPLGLVGNHCEHDVDECVGHKCPNGMQCIDKLRGYECRCSDSRGVCGSLAQGCQTNPCVTAGSVCQETDELGSFHCECPRGYQGSRCSEDVDECAAHICEHDGLCRNKPGKFECFCRPGYTGTRCHIEVNECLSQPCFNGATCVDGVNEYKCICPGGYLGDHCEIDFNECASSPCMHGATCLDQEPRWKGQQGFSGTAESRAQPDCPTSASQGFEQLQFPHRWVEGTKRPSSLSPRISTNVQVQNFLRRSSTKAGSCSFESINVRQAAEMLTSSWWSVRQATIKNCWHQSGLSLMQDANEQEEHVMVSEQEEKKGTVIDSGVWTEVNGFRCNCPAGYEGTRCEIDIDECQSGPCLNGAGCLDLVNGVKAIGIFPNLTNSFVIGQFHTQLQVFVSVGETLKGYSSWNRNTSYVQTVEGNVCRYECNCTDTGFEGEHCERNIDDCYPGACHHGGTCEDRVRGFQCHCHEAYEGSSCEIDIPDCDPPRPSTPPCENGAACLERSNASLYHENYLGLFQSFSYATAAGYVCLCPPGFNGTRCENNIDDCPGHNCSVYGHCVDLVNAYRCECQAGYEGIDCGTEVNECEAYQPCRNGATCRDKVADYECTCADGYGDKNCSTLLLGCRKAPCLNDARCEPLLTDDGQHSYRCHCLPGFAGNTCQTVTTASLNNGSTWDLNVSVDQQREGFLDHHKLRMQFRTTLPAGLLARVTVDKSRVLLVTLSEGRVLVKSADDTVSLTVGEGLNNAEWNELNLEMSLGSIFVFLTEGGNATALWLGYDPVTPLVSVVLGSGQKQNRSGFIGCLREVWLDGVLQLPRDQGGLAEGCPREEQCVIDTCSGQGTCVDLWNQHECHCRRPYYGERCNNNPSVVHPSSGDESFLAARLHDGQLQVLLLSSSSGGAGATYVPKVLHPSKLRLDDGKLHFIQVWFNESWLGAAVDGQESLEPPMSGGSGYAIAPHIIYLGWLQPQSQPPLRRRRQVGSSSWLAELTDSVGNVDAFKGVLQDFRLWEKHFHPSDFVTSTSYMDTITVKVIEVLPKLRRLRPGTVPSIFPGCPKYFSQHKNVAREGPAEKRACIEAKALQNALQESLITHQEEEKKQRHLLFRGPFVHDYK
ncbi:hypothetical protein HPB51_001863 [Rhipicephalus microplus]|uniref:Uncharacterized protein n=1 Tax=Rhipicephalus microplus TaxID=6941 RepID=A0A9J6EEJ3_RHIMP|nr:hypothetical protein HPB51_001863 [Rhipicephalus microplus]